MKNVLKLLFICLLVVSCKGKDESSLTILTDNSEVIYKVDVAKTPEQLSTGLMNIEALDENKGMIFDLTSVENVAMWMKNTKISLDIVFLNNSGEIVWIHENATPMSEDIIKSPKEFAYVLEVNAGQAEKNQFKVGDTVKHAFFDK